jgi:Butirosin biosynthesis protein H, N-terminal
VKTVLAGVHPWRHDLAGCLHACAATLLRFHGVPPLDALGSAWGFYYPPGDYRHEEYYFPCPPGRSLLETLAPYHPVRSRWCQPADAVEGWEQVRARIAAGRPAAVAVDNFHLPFRPAYHDVHSSHLIVIYGFDDEAGTVRVLDSVPPRFDGDIALADLTAARDSSNPAQGDRDMFFAGRRIGNRWLAAEAGSPEPSGRDRVCDHLRRNVRGFAAAVPHQGMAALRGFLGGMEQRLAAGEQVSDELFVVAGTALAASALHADWLMLAGRAYGEPAWTELGRHVERIAHHWTAIRIMAALTRSGAVPVGRLRRRHRALLQDQERVLAEIAEVS